MTANTPCSNCGATLMVVDDAFPITETETIVVWSHIEATNCDDPA